MTLLPSASTGVFRDWHVTQQTIQLLQQGNLLCPPAAAPKELGLSDINGCLPVAWLCQILIRLHDHNHFICQGLPKKKKSICLWCQWCRDAPTEPQWTQTSKQVRAKHRCPRPSSLPLSSHIVWLLIILFHVFAQVNPLISSRFCGVKLVGREQHTPFYTRKVGFTWRTAWMVVDCINVVNNILLLTTILLSSGATSCRLHC